MKLKCPKCKTQSLKEDYSDLLGVKKMKTHDIVYCPECGFTDSRKKLELREENITSKNSKL